MRLGSRSEDARLTFTSVYVKLKLPFKSVDTLWEIGDRDRGTHD